MGVQFGKDARKQIVRGDVVASFQYVNGEESCVLWRLNTLNNSLLIRQAGCVVIGLSSAWKYTDDAYLVRQAKEYAQVMGFESSKHIVHRIATFIQDMLIELVSMKPMPAELERKQPEAEIALGERGLEIVLH
jgi:hypothetical protein